MNPGWLHFAILNGWSTIGCACWRSAAFTADTTSATVLLFLFLFCSLTLNHTHNLKIDCNSLEGGTLKGTWANSGLARRYSWHPHEQESPCLEQPTGTVTLKVILMKILTSSHTYKSPKARGQEGMRAEIHKDCLIRAAKNYSQRCELIRPRGKQQTPGTHPSLNLRGWTLCKYIKPHLNFKT